MKVLILFMFFILTIYSQIIFNTDIFVPGQEVPEAYAFCYRIPAITNMGNNQIIAFAEGRKFSCGDNEFKNIVWKTSQDGGKTWSDAQVLNSNYPNTTVWGNPAVYYDKPLNIVYVQVIEEISGRTVQFLSHNRGNSFEKLGQSITRKELGYAWAYPGPGKAIRLENGTQAGRILYCGWRYNLLTSLQHNFVWYSDDNGLTYKPSVMDEKTLSDHEPNECQPVETDNGNVRLYSRLGNAHMISVADSTDGGTTFGPRVSEKEMPSVIVQFGLEKNQGVYYWSISNAMTRFGRTRGQLTVYASANGLTDWKPVQVITEGVSGYNNLVSLDSRTMAIMYETGEYHYTQRISYAAFYI